MGHTVRTTSGETMTEQIPEAITSSAGTPLEGPTVEERLAAAEARAQAAEEAAVAAQEAATGTPARYGVYDTTYEKFVGPVVDKKPTPKQAREAVGHDGFEVREV